MEQPPASLAIQGLIRPALIEEHSVIQKHLSNLHSNDATLDNKDGESVELNSEDVRINGHRHESDSSKDNSTGAEESEKDDITTNRATFYKLEMIKIQLFSANGHQVYF